MECQKIYSLHKDKHAPITEAEMTCAGITRVPADMFHYRGFKYTNLQDAMAQAKRDADGKQT